MHGLVIHLTAFPCPLQQMLVWSESNSQPCSGSCDVHGGGLQHSSSIIFEKHTSPILQHVWGRAFPFPKSFIRKPTLFSLFASASALHAMALQHLGSFWEGRPTAVPSFGSSRGSLLGQVVQGENSETLSANILMHGESEIWNTKFGMFFSKNSHWCCSPATF